MSYDLEAIIDECLTDKGTRFGISKEMYFETWNAVNKWVNYRLAKKKGASIPLLGKFTWERVDDNVSRPVFILHDSFVKLHRVKKARVFKEPDLAPVDELNYSQISIKYSEKLTKDMVFVGIRDIVKKIGDYVDRMYEFEVPFSCGVMTSAERRVKFEFNLGKLQDILPESVRQTNKPETATSNLSETADFDYSRASTSDFASCDSPSGRMSGTVPPLSLTQGLGSGANSQIPTPLSEQGDLMRAGETVNSKFKVERPPSPGLQANLINSLSLNSSIPPGASNAVKALIKKDRQAHALKVVQEQAFMRCLDTVADHAAFEDTWKEQSDAIRQQNAQEEMEKKEKKAKFIMSTQELLKRQIAEARAMKEQQMRERGSAEYNFHIGGTKSGYMEDIMNKTRKVEKSFIGKLEQQINENRQRKEMAKAQKQQEEREYLDHIAMEMDMKNVADHMNHLEKQQLLLSAWERDGHVRNLKRLQSNGVNSIRQYISTNVEEEEQEQEGLTGRMSIGYDSRKLK
jgi:hypothetical protein